MKYVASLWLAGLLISCQPATNPAQEAVLVDLRQTVAHQQDSLALLTAHLAQAQAKAATLLTAVANQPLPQLYQKPVVTALPEAELPEVLSLFDSTTTFEADEYGIKAFRVCNGPSDPDLDYCNCSHCIYLALNTYDLPCEYKAYRIGPFYEAEFAGWTGSKTQADLRISHTVKGQKRVNTFRISWAGVRQL